MILIDHDFKCILITYVIHFLESNTEHLDPETDVRPNNWIVQQVDRQGVQINPSQTWTSTPLSHCPVPVKAQDGGDKSSSLFNAAIKRKSCVEDLQLFRETDHVLLLSIQSITSNNQSNGGAGLHNPVERS